jgi:hypothetical protein
MIPTQAKLEEFRAEMFQPLVGESLSLTPVGVDGSSDVQLKLLEVKIGRKSPLFTREPFSLLFALKDQPPLGNCLYGLQHPQFEPAGFLVSRVVAPKYERIDPDAMYYEAVFT